MIEHFASRLTAQRFRAPTGLYTPCTVWRPVLAKRKNQAASTRRFEPADDGMKFAYEDLSDEQFERLVVFLCQHLLGIGVQGFAKGPDGGRDAKFVGTAELHPSKASPWKGITIIQAKHTNGFNRLFSEVDFFSTKAGSSSVIGDELPRIKKLRKTRQLDHYMLFANRRLGANAEAEIRKHIAEECRIPEESVYLCGIEQLEVWMKTFPDVPRNADLDPVDAPLIISPDDLAEIVEAFGRHRELMGDVLDDPPTQRVSYDQKNKHNNMTREYAKAQGRRYLKDTAQIRRFLASPENAELLELYESVADEFELKIVAKRRNYQTFDEVLEYLADLLFARDPLLRQRQHKRLTRAMLFYMYWNCDIGQVEDAAAN